ncbi:MAG: dephospho-CoA kinase [Oscillospiraceae bacterium]|jgi:dephospho-CoA kinase|nr:dephospho-CoA kinase [Oscillospiraceae bacterium]
MIPGISSPIIGLMGKSGSGKTEAGYIFRELGCYVIDCDMLARDITRPGQQATLDLAAYFGSDILDEEGRLKRHLLAERAFANEENRRMLSQLTHPEIEKLALRIVHTLPRRYESIVFDGAALPESTFIRWCDVCVEITCPRHIRIQRVMNRDLINREAAEKRMDAQKNLDYSCCRFHINNDGEWTPEYMMDALAEVIAAAKTAAASKF